MGGKVSHLPTPGGGSPLKPTLKQYAARNPPPPSTSKIKSRWVVGPQGPIQPAAIWFGKARAAVARRCDPELVGRDGAGARPPGGGIIVSVDDRFRCAIRIRGDCVLAPPPSDGSYHFTTSVG